MILLLHRFGFPCCRLVFGAQQGFQCVELFVPEALVTPEPLIGFRKPRRLQPTEMASALDRACYEASVLQHPHVFGGARETHAEGGRQFPDREFPFRKLAKHGPAGWVREGMKDGVEMG